MAEPSELLTTTGDIVIGDGDESISVEDDRAHRVPNRNVNNILYAFFLFLLLYSDSLYI